MENPDVKLSSPEMDLLRLNKKDAYNYRERRHLAWTENYELYRDTVQINRLTQRQSVHIPLMKQMIQTLLTSIDDMPVIEFQNLDNNGDAQIFRNEHWKATLDANNADEKDLIDKKQFMFKGRTFDQWQIENGKVKWSISDPNDILVSRYMDPADLHSSRYLIHTHIFVPLSKLKQNKEYDQTEVTKLEQYYKTAQGLIKIASNRQTLEEKNKTLSELGVHDIESPILGETYVELSLHFIYRNVDLEGKEIEERIFYYVEADDMVILLRKPLEDIYGVTKDNWWRNHYPYESWAGDVDNQDVWTDGPADIIRTPNKILDSFFSQMVENRTLRNFGMNYYDASIEGFIPPTNQAPIPGGWYPLPGKPSEVYQKVDVPDLSESLDEMGFIIQMLEKATGATATLQGAQTDRKVTLGEVQLALTEAKGRVKGLSKFYTGAWKRRAILFDHLVEGGKDKLDVFKIHKKGKNSSDIFTREVDVKETLTAQGYAVKVWSQDEKDTQDTQKVEKLNAVRANIPGNQKLEEVYKRALLEFANVNPNDINDIMDIEEKKANMPPMEIGPDGQPIQPTQPQTVQNQPNQPPMQAPTMPVVPPLADQPMNMKSKKMVSKLKSLRSKISANKNG